MAAILDHCKVLLIRIQQILDNLMKPRSPDTTTQTVSFTTNIKWVFSKRKVDNLRTRLESAKVTLSVMMSGFDWALLLNQKECAEMSSPVITEANR
jgi:hypothetical protein